VREGMKGGLISGLRSIVGSIALFGMAILPALIPDAYRLWALDRLAKTNKNDVAAVEQNLGLQGALPEQGQTTPDRVRYNGRQYEIIIPNSAPPRAGIFRRLGIEVQDRFRRPLNFLRQGFTSAS
jgi:hypothetical protein